MVLVIIVIVLLVLFAMGMLFTALRRRDSRFATGRLSRETKARDKSAAVAAEAEAAAARGAGAGDAAAPGTTIATTAAAAEQAATIAWRSPTTEVVEGQIVTHDWTPPTQEAIGVSRRQFLNRSIIGFMGLGLTGFGGAVLGFLWPPFVTGFGAVINAGNIGDLKNQIRDGNGFYKVPEGKMWITEYPASALEKARAIYTPDELAGMEQGLVALFWKCPHLGCAVPECVTSQWFECPCHGSQYNRVGEKRGGPAPRGMDRFKVSVNDKNELLVDTGTIIPGPPVGTNTTGQEAEGPNCIGQASH